MSDSELLTFISALAKKPPGSELVESLVKKKAAESNEFTVQAPLSVLALDESPIPGVWPLYGATVSFSA